MISHKMNHRNMRWKTVISSSRPTHAYYKYRRFSCSYCPMYMAACLVKEQKVCYTLPGSKSFLDFISCSCLERPMCCPPVAVCCWFCASFELAAWSSSSMWKYAYGPQPKGEKEKSTIFKQREPKYMNKKINSRANPQNTNRERNSLSEKDWTTLIMIRRRKEMQVTHHCHNKSCHISNQIGYQWHQSFHTFGREKERSSTDQ